MDINGKTKVFGLLGNPIKHTISPFIHELLYREANYNGTYNPFFVPKGEIENAVKGMVGLNIEGLNVTVPYKVDVMATLDELDHVAKGIGAVNTIVRENGGLKGYNTDWIGLKMSCDIEKIPIKDRDIVIVGAGGSARAVGFMCLEEGAKSITILNRTVSKAEVIVESLHKYWEGESGTLNGKSSKLHGELTGPVLKFGALTDLNMVKEGSVAFQTTSLGLHPNTDSTPVSDSEFFDKVDFIVDIIYNPKETAFMKLGQEHGAKVSNGLGMLFYQAVKAFELWTDIKLSDEQLLKVFGELENYVYIDKN